jgi:amino acid adenylation domain-containing protein
VNARAEPAAGGQPERYVFPASFAQQRLWFLEQLEGTGSAWNVRLPVRLTGPLDVAALEQALALVVARHESLRTIFGMRAGDIVQFVAGHADVPLQRVALPPGDAASREERLRALLGRLAAEPFDLREGPLLRAFLVVVAPGDHALLLVSHHIVSDAWSSGVLFRDLALAYAALARGREPAWPELPVQYADFAVWQRDWLSGPELERQVAWWREHLAGAPAVLDLPLDHPRPRLQSYRGTRLGHALPPELTARLKQVAAGEGATLFMLLFAAFNALLARWSGQHDLVVGTPIAGRRRTELEGLVGFFANTLALRTRVEPRQPFRELLRAVRGTSLDAFAHQDLPFEKLVEVLRPARSLAHSPVFQVLFVLQNAPWDADGFGDLAVAPAEMAPGDSSRFDLSLSVAEFEGRLWLGLEYCTDLFAGATVEALARGYEALLAGVAADAGTPVAELPVESPADRARQLHDWQPAWTGPPADALAQFAARVREMPRQVAVECGGERLTYAELDARVEAIARGLRAAGLSPEAPVALCLARSADLPAALLAVWRAGGHYLPLDPSHPPARLRAILADAGATLLVTSPEFAGRLEGADMRVLDVAMLVAAGGGAGNSRSERDSERRDIPAAPPAAPPPAYLIYTSGSTGQPKGVRVSRPSVDNFLASMAAEPGLAPGERLLAVTTLAFDIAVLELLLPLTVGATAVIATEEEVRDPKRLRQRLDESGITVMQATPSLWRNLVAAGWPGSPGLRLLCGGEALDRELASRLQARGAELWNLYGPTETTVWSCVAPVADATGPVPVGRPIANTRCYVLDDAGRPVPVGARGELWIGGDGVALGYHRRPDLTADRFRDDPFAAGSGRPGRMYRTGDRARWRRDGRLEILGRTDFQLKLRGFRLEPGEIEATLLALPGVAAAVVVLREIAGDPRLVAYLVPAGPAPPEDELLGALRATLPAWMVPARIVWLAALPLTPNGKVDRAALPAPVAADAPMAGPASGPPPTPAEYALLRIFRELLGAAVGPDDDFFARGGHSLLATRAVARIAADLRVTVPLRAMFEAPTVRGLAARLPAGVLAAPAAGVPGAPATVGSGREVPLSLVQQRLWFLDRLQPGNPAYHLAWAFELRGPLDRPALQGALDALATRHGSLRTRFADRDGEPVQVVGPPAGLPLTLATAGADRLASLAGDFAERPFDLANGPPARALLVATGADAHVLVIVIHHIVADGWSFGVLARELAAAYAAARAGRPAALPPLATDYADYAREQRRALAGGELARQLSWWRERLKGAPPFLDLPTDRPRAAVASSRGARRSRVLPPELQAALRELAAREGCTLFVVLLAAFDILLARMTGSEDLVVGTPVAGRPRADLEGLVGFFVNTLVLRTDLTGNPTVRELLSRVRAGTLAAWEHADVPFELLVEALQPPRSTSRTPLFQVLFNLHSEPAAPLALDGLEVAPLAIPRQSAKFDLGVSLAETARGLAVTVEYGSDLFVPASIDRLLGDYAGILAALAERPGARLHELPFAAGTAAPVTPADVRAAAPPTAGSLVAAVADAARARPLALAVAAPATDHAPAVDWDYAGLAAEASRIAAALGAHGLAPGGRVGLWFGHGAGQVAGMLGVLQAGGAYVPLDPAAPPARLVRILRDAGVALVLADASAPPWPAALAGDGLTLLRREALPAAAGPAILPVTPDSLAYILYTSGTTGTPKGVPQTHGNALRFVTAWAGSLGLTADDRLSLLSTYGYDAAVQDVFGALVTGASVCPLDVRRLDRETLLDRVTDRGLTVLHGTPTVYRYLFGGHVACRQDLSRVRCVVLGGEPARRADFELFRSRFRRGARFVNGYGLTEATAVAQWHADHDTLPRGLTLPIGRPLPDGGVQVLLLDGQGAPAAFSGEIVIEAPHVAPGYWNVGSGGQAGAAGMPRSERAGVRRDLPVAPADPPAPRRFRTGDLARFNPDGDLVFLGRRDERVKVGGIRIEPGEVEAALREVPGIAEAVVVAVEEVPGEPLLAAWFTTVPGAEAPAVPALRLQMSARLPGSFVPARWHHADTLPRLPNGKVDRRALAAGAAAGGHSRSGRDSELRDIPPGAVPATTARAEEVLQEIWQALLKAPSVGLDDDFFLLGGHSLLATRLVARVRDRLGVELPLIRVFEAPTIRGLARFLARPAGDESGMPSGAISPPGGTGDR